MANEKIANGTVLRVEKKKDYTILHTQMFHVTNMSMNAKGLLCTMLQLPDHWNFSIAGLKTLCSDSETKVRNALNELIELGYVTREQMKPDKQHGGRIYWQYTVSEQSKTPEKLQMNNTKQAP